jgi:hypothetical protein
MFTLIDEELYRDSDNRCLGRVRPHQPMFETMAHALRLDIPDGEIRQLTGCVFAFHHPIEGLRFFELTN